MEKENTLKRAVFYGEVKSFESWLNQNNDAEILCISGEYSDGDVKKMSELLSNFQTLMVDISELNTQRKDYEDDITDGTFKDEIYLLEKMILNKKYGSVFKVRNRKAFSSDGRVLVHVPVDSAVEIPSSVEIIGRYAACGNKVVDYLIFPTSVRIIDDNAFSDCENLESVNMHNGITAIGECSFDGCPIEYLRLSNSLEKIPACCYAGNYLTDVVIPSSVKKIEASAFHASHLKELRLPEGVESIECDAVWSPGYVWFPSTMREIDKDFFCDAPIQGRDEETPYIDVDERNPWFFSKNGTLFSRDNPSKPYLGCPYNGYKWRE